MTNKYLIPPVNIVGKFKLKDPLTNLINPFLPYKVYAVESIKKIIEDGIDVLNVIYKEQGLTEDDYNKDILEDNVIVTLVGEDSINVYVPSRYIDTVPEALGEIFIQKSIIVSLNYLPVKLDLSFIATEVNDLVSSMLGVDADTVVEDLSNKIIVGFDEAKEFETKRTKQIVNNETCQFKLGKCIENNKLQNTKIALLLKRIKYLEEELSKKK